MAKKTSGGRHTPFFIDSNPKSCGTSAIKKGVVKKPATKTGVSKSSGYGKKSKLGF